ncbi:hypothetical protein O2W14_13930 [Modestobacter sp. VKM Ac-2986]|uniref:hypothetical protein n=1 Tax=Modestobacter sp. VKM Ac-2986 TaxID=3004140 RepID=UPI0022ABACBA|nr:hypothetical protein [Modestobacter sp. VKM Ac-2986]MCZ2829934.1 hypothetical protein [Modestobacter sp. VKM Ac-2986]
MTGSRAADRRRGRRWLRPAGVAACSLLVATLLVGPAVCWGRSSAPAMAASATVPAPVPRELRESLGSWTPPVDVDVPALLAEVGAAAAEAGATVNAVVVDAAGRTLLETPTADREVYTASLVKLFLVQQLLVREAAGPSAFDPGDRLRMERAITVSDDEAMSILWDRYSGDALVSLAVTQFELDGSGASSTGQWGESTTSATDLARFLGTLSRDRQVPGAEALLGWMRAAEPVADDGFDQRFGLLADGVAPGAAVKQGWMCCVDDLRHLHSVGVLPDGRVVVVVAEAPAWTSWSVLTRSVDETAAALVAGTA